MASGDRTRWDEKYERAGERELVPSLPAHFSSFVDRFSTARDACEIACGTGTTAVWLALRGVQVTAYDISPVAISAAVGLAAAHQVGDRCTFATHDFDHGLPEGEPVDLIVCNMFRDTSLDDAMVQRLRPRGVLAIAALSEVGAEPGRFRVTAGALPRAFGSLDELASGEGDGVAWLIASKR